MTLSEYGSIRHEIPYVLKACTRDKLLLYVGVRHSRSLQDESTALLISEMMTITPTVVLVEGVVPDVSGSLEDAVKTWGESGAVAHLAKSMGVPIRSLESSLSEQAADLQKKFGNDKAVAFYGLRAIAQERSRDPKFNLDDFLGKRLLPWLHKNGMAVHVQSADAFQALAIKATNDQNIVEAVTSQWFDPLGKEDQFGFRTISTYLVSARDSTMTNRLVNALSDGGRVLAVAGHSHVVMQEPAIRHLLGCTTPTRTDAYRPSPSLARCDQVCKVE